MNQSDFHIRLAEPRDLESLVTFNLALARETEGRQLDRTMLQAGVESLLADASKGFYVVMEHRPSGQTIGQMLITFEWSDWRNAVFWWLQSVYVQKEWRRRGVFKKLYDYVLREGKRQGNVAGIRLYVEQDNTVAQGVYKQAGLSTAPYKMFETDFILPSRPGE
ncbi:MAG: GNAT family N-acetyltransferase [Nitrospira sp.]|nr:GNAT family N-acetyltransferase [Nitrospira sp.]MCY4131012.1 GNAT family N-acetyltransferase [Nitrospira sp.]